MFWFRATVLQGAVAVGVQDAFGGAFKVFILPVAQGPHERGQGDGSKAEADQYQEEITGHGAASAVA